VNKRVVAIIGAVVGTVLILALYGLIVRGILREREQQAALEMQIEPFEMALADQQGGAQVLPTRQAELATLQAELAGIQIAFPSEFNSTDVLDHIVTAATNHGVNLRQVQVQDPLTDTLGADTYYVFTYDVEVEGRLGAIAAFLAALESGSIETLILDQISLEAQPTPAAEYQTSLVVRVYVRH
jgi:Tfp pilus assembly protein PilO